MTACPTFMIIPSLACQASCSYCFGPHEGAIMDESTALETVAFICAIAEETKTDKVSILFHGGEPLLAPYNLWKTLLEEIQLRLSCYELELSVQSNLWNLSNEMLKLLAKHKVSLGTSLDGPEHICDASRHKGYFQRTMPSLKRAVAAGQSVSAIATITKDSLPHTQEIAQFFRDEDIALVLHGAVNALDGGSSNFALSSEEYAKMLTQLYPWYVDNRKSLRIDTLDTYVKGILYGNPSVCTFRDCLGMFLAISPTGDITACQRLTGQKEYRLGILSERPTLAELMSSPAAEAHRAREKAVQSECGSCEYYALCKGGCYYNSLVAKQGTTSRSLTSSSADCHNVPAKDKGVIDPYCSAYKKVYAFVWDKLMEEMRNPENAQAIAARPALPGEHPLLREGPYISLGKETHPSTVAGNARSVLALYELASEPDPLRAAETLNRKGICGDIATTAQVLATTQEALSSTLHIRNNCYAHVTFDCNLRCSHCYAEGGSITEEMQAADFAQLIAEASAAGFRQLVITGGEPLVHSEWERLMQLCHAYKNSEDARMNLVLRTNLTGEYTADDMRMLALSFDQVVVSVDGNESSHDARRGQGAYEIATKNLKTYQQEWSRLSNRKHTGELSLACVMSSQEIAGAEGQSVRELGDKLGVKRVRFRPLLPLGRAATLSEPVMCEGLMQHVTPSEMLMHEVQPLTTCGIGHNLFVRPDGKAYPCYTWCKESTFLGNVFEMSLEALLASPQYCTLEQCTVDMRKGCRDCFYRYLCGGACRAWGNQDTLDVNEAPAECSHLKERAKTLLDYAQKYLLEE